MAVKDNLTARKDIAVAAREIDFVTRFGASWERLREIMGILRPIRKENGAILRAKRASVTLAEGTVAEGEEIPYSQASVSEVEYGPITVEKYAKAVSIEAIADKGYEAAVQMTDNEFLFQLQSEVTRRFYAYLRTGTLTSSEPNWQRALAMAKGRVLNRFKRMRRAASGIVGFVNVLDLYDYLGDRDVTVQSDFGFQYVKNFLGYDTVFLLSDEEVPRGQVIATPVENIALYYVDPSDSDYARAGLAYTTDGETNLIGVHMQGNYQTAVSEVFAILGMTLFAEYQDAIAVVTVDPDPALGELTVTASAGADGTHTRLSVTPEIELPGGGYRVALGEAAREVAFGQDVSGWAAWDGEAEVACVSGQTATVVEADGALGARRAGSAAVQTGE